MRFSRYYTKNLDFELNDTKFSDNKKFEIFMKLRKNYFIFSIFRFSQHFI